MKTEAERRPWRRSSDATATMGFAAALVVLCVMIAGPGVGKGVPPTGTVRGAVTIRSEKLTAGRVCVVSDKGAAAVATIAADGSYIFKDRLPVGEYSVWLEMPAREPPPPPGISPPSSPPSHGMDEATWRRLVPSRYATQALSPLRFVVKPGTNEIPIEIAD